MPAASILRRKSSKRSIGGQAEVHELAARHFDLFDLERLELDDHVVDGEIVIGVAADAEVEFAVGGGGERGGASEDRSERAAGHVHSIALRGRGVASASVRRSVHLMASRNMFCTSGRSQFSGTCPSVE